MNIIFIEIKIDLFVTFVRRTENYYLLYTRYPVVEILMMLS